MYTHIHTGIEHVTPNDAALVCNTLGKSCHLTSRFFRTQTKSMMSSFWMRWRRVVQYKVNVMCIFTIGAHMKSYKQLDGARPGSLHWARTAHIYRKIRLCGKALGIPSKSAWPIQVLPHARTFICIMYIAYTIYID